jgi:hypothetical protein
VTQPDDDVWSIGPEERTYFSRHLHRIVNAEPLQRLNVKRAIVKLTLNALIPVNTLSFTKHLSTHDESPRFSAARGISNRHENVGDELLLCESLETDSDTISRMMRTFENFVDV